MPSEWPAQAVGFGGIKYEIVATEALKALGGGGYVFFQGTTSYHPVAV